MKGTIIHIEGMDGVGKSTQTELLTKSIQEYVDERGVDSQCIITQHFPIYDNPSSLLVREYLKGTFGKATEVDPYTASILYSADRSLSYHNNADWAKVYNDGGIVICDRYTDSNVSLQVSKFFDQDNFPPFYNISHSFEFRKYLSWLYDLEYNTLKIPRPDIVIYLVMNPDNNKKLLDGRDTAKDIHELDSKLQYNGGVVIQAFNDLDIGLHTDEIPIKQDDIDLSIVRNTTHVFISCDNYNGKIKSIEEIHHSIIDVINMHHIFESKLYYRNF